MSGFLQVASMIETALQYNGVNTTWWKIEDESHIEISLENKSKYEYGGRVCCIHKNELPKAIELVKGISHDIPIGFTVSFRIRVSHIQGTKEVV